MVQDHYLFIDAAALRSEFDRIVREYFSHKADYQIDLNILSQQFGKIFYYDAMPGVKPGESESRFTERKATQTRLLATAMATDRVHVRVGDTVHRKGRGLEQKKVDVMIAVDMMVHAARKNMRAATLLTGDSDFVPLLDALVHEGVHTIIRHPAQARADLKDAADSRESITLPFFFDLLTTESIKYFPRPESIGYPRGFMDQGQLLAEQSDGNHVFELYKRSDGLVAVVWAYPGSSHVNSLAGISLKLVRDYALTSNKIRIPHFLNIAEEELNTRL